MRGNADLYFDEKKQSHTLNKFGIEKSLLNSSKYGRNINIIFVFDENSAHFLNGGSILLAILEIFSRINF